jgi:uncharacterized membrane protein YqjE
MNRDRNTGTASQGAASRLLRSVVQLLDTVSQAVQTRGELLTTEVEEEFGRVGRVLLLGMGTLLVGILGALIAAFVVVLVFWDTHRLAAALAVLGVFLLAAALCGFAVRRELRSRPRLFEAMLTTSRGVARGDRWGVRGRSR